MSLGKENKNEIRIKYDAAPTIAKFHESDAFVRGIMGPVGSGKSTGCCMEIMRRAQEQEPGPDGKRKTRFLIARNTYRELRDTTLNTWLDWFPEEYFGDFNHSEMIHPIKMGDIQTEILFRALDKPMDVAKVLSLELTGAWVNEAREIPKAIIDALGDRVERYPPVKWGGGCTWSGVIMDTNPPDDDHWWYRLAEEEKPDEWEFFKQPGGLYEEDGVFLENPNAENIENLKKHYYLKRMHGKSKDYIRVYYCGNYGFVQEGKPVYPEYIDNVHCADSPLEPNPHLPIYIGIDFGRTPAAVFGQLEVTGRWIWFDELVTEDMGAVKFAEQLGAKIRRDYKNFSFEIYCDPAGEHKTEVDDDTPLKILRAKNIPARPTHTNDPTIRREAVAVPLQRMIDGKPGLLISPKCRVTRKGMNGGYAYKRVQVAGEERYHDKASKNRYSHPCEAGQYMMLGGGEGRSVISSSSGMTPDDVERLQRAYGPPSYRQATGEGPLDF